MTFRKSEKLYDLCFDHAKYVYDDLADTWRDIERKAQGNVAIAGIFLAGVSLMYRSVDTPSDALNVASFLSVLFLAASAVCSVRVLLVSEMEGIEDLKDIRRDIERIALGDSLEVAEDQYRQFRAARVREWVRVNAGLSAENAKKAYRLKNAQRILMVGILGMVVVVFLAVFG